MKQKIHKTLSLLLTTVLLLGLLTPVALAAGKPETIQIRTAEDLADLAKQCTLDSWSQGKTVCLEADIALKEGEFTPIPTFGGTFEGQGHTISGVFISGSGNVRGLFRYIQPTGVVEDLTVEGSAAPTDRKNTIGGLAGSNRGTVRNCSFSGEVSGTDTIGGLVGVNEAEGQIINCSFSGSVTGEHYVGGIAGQNLGSIIQCKNSGSINTTEVDAEVSLEDLNTEQLNSAENMPACTDIGGIAGFSSGIVQSCVNTGAVGYAHVGYNIGGIAGRQSGYLDGCTNSGTVLGRKDVGGIAGQLEPEVSLLYNKGRTGELLDELDVLRNLIDQTQTDLRGASDELTERMQALSQRAGQAQDAIGNFSDAAADWANDNIGQINSLTARASWLIDNLTPVVQDGTDAMDLVEKLAEQLGDAAQQAQTAGQLGAGAAGQMESAATQLKAAADHGRDSAEHLKTAIKHLRDGLGDSTQTARAAAEVGEATSGLADSFQKIADGFARMQDALDKGAGTASGTQTWTTLADQMGAFQRACAALPDCLEQGGEALVRLLQDGENQETAGQMKAAGDALLAAKGTFETAGAKLAQTLAQVQMGDVAAEKALETDLTEFTAARETLCAAGDQVSKLLGSSSAPEGERWKSAMEGLNSALTEAETAEAQLETDLGKVPGKDSSQLSAVRTDLRSIKTAAQSLQAIGTQWNLAAGDADPWEEARLELQRAGEDLSSAMEDFSRAAETSAAAVRQLKEALTQAGDAAAQLHKAGDTARQLSTQLSGMSESLSRIFRELSTRPTITIRPIDSPLREQGDALGEVFSGLLDDGDALRETMSSTSDTLLDDLEGISDQFGVITDLLRDMLQGSADEDLKDRFEDVSDQETGQADTGFLSNSRNQGIVEGDINVAGIVGSMAIEYDFDPEDDLVQQGDRSLDFRYQTRAAAVSCVNTGEVTGKQDCAGGVVGLMDLGRVSGCENYGTVSSTDGDYVGGIAGASWGSIRDSWSKCHLSGGDYVGGVAGLGATVVNCHTLVDIEKGSAYLGAVAGDMDSGGQIQGNTFTSDDLGALDGISYAGKAEPVDFDTLCTTSGVPELFSQLELTFVADGVTVAVIPFQYGGGIEALPEIPAKKGYSASWPDLDYTCLTASQTLEAEYTPYTSALTDGGELPEILVDGSFSTQATVTHTTKEVTWTDGNVHHSGTAYTVEVDDPDLEQGTYTVHYRLPDTGKRYTLWVLGEDGSWSRQDYETDGQYLLLRAQDNPITFCVTEGAANWSVLVAVIGGLALAGLAVVLLLRRHRSRQHRTGGNS